MKSCAIAGGLLLLAVLLQARACPVLRRDVNCKDNYGKQIVVIIARSIMLVSVIIMI